MDSYRVSIEVKRLGRALLRFLVLSWVLATAAGAAKPQDPFIQPYDQAMRDYRAGHYAQAIINFQVAYQVEPKPRLLFNIGQAHLKLGQAQAALVFFERFQREERNVTADIASRLQACMHEARELLDKAERARVLQADGEAPSVLQEPALRPQSSPTVPAAEPVVMALPAGAAQEISARRGRLSHTRKAIAGTLAGLLVASLTTSIVLTALDGRSGVIEEDGLYVRAHSAFAPLYGVGYAASGLLAGSLVLTLALPERKPQ